MIWGWFYDFSRVWIKVMAMSHNHDSCLMTHKLWVTIVSEKSSRKETDEQGWNGRFDERSKSLPGDNEGFFREGSPPTEKREKVLKGLPPDSTPSKTERIVWKLLRFLPLLSFSKTFRAFESLTIHNPKWPFVSEIKTTFFMQNKTKNVSLYGGREAYWEQNSSTNCNYETLHWISYEWIAQRPRSEPLCRVENSKVFV